MLKKKYSFHPLDVYLNKWISHNIREKWQLATKFLGHKRDCEFKPEAFLTLYWFECVPVFVIDSKKKIFHFYYYFSDFIEYYFGTKVDRKSHFFSLSNCFKWLIFMKFSKWLRRNLITSDIWDLLFEIYKGFFVG